MLGGIMWEKYKRFTVRQGSSAQCSPGLIVFGLVVAVLAMCYVYRQVILDTLEVAGLVVATGLVGWAVVSFVRHQVRYQRQMQAERPIPALVSDPSADYQNEAAEVFGDMPHSFPSLGEVPTVREPAVDKPVPAGLDAEIDADLLELTGK
jgi:hypothetical protein